MQGWKLGLQLGVATFVAALFASLLAPAVLLFMVLGVATAAVLSGDARRAGPRQGRIGLLALGLVAGGFLLLVWSSAVATAAFAAGDTARYQAMVWVRFAAEVAVAGGLFAAPSHLAGERSQLFLALGLGGTATIALVGAYASMDASRQQLAESATLAKGVPYILFAWAYATILGRLRASGGPGRSPAA